MYANIHRIKYVFFKISYFLFKDRLCVLHCKMNFSEFHSTKTFRFQIVSPFTFYRRVVAIWTYSIERLNTDLFLEKVEVTRFYFWISKNIFKKYLLYFDKNVYSLLLNCNVIMYSFISQMIFNKFPSSFLSFSDEYLLKLLKIHTKK